MGSSHSHTEIVREKVVEIRYVDRPDPEVQRRYAEAERRYEEARSKLEALEGEIATFSSPETFEAKQKEVRDQLLDQVKALPPPPKLEGKRIIAVLGQRGVGKSSTINALAGRKVTAAGDVDTTTEILKAFETDTVAVYDVPGMHDQRIYFNFKHITKIQTLSCAVVMYVDGIELVINLIQLVRACGVPLVVVRNKTEAVDSDKVMEVERATMLHLLGQAYPLFHISAKTGKGVEALCQELGLPYQRERGSCTVS